MTRAPLAATAALAAGLLAATPAAAQISRTEVIDRAKAFVFHPFRCTAANLTASCAPTYHSQYQPGDYLGVAYNWGGFDSLFGFDQKIADGDGAGNPPGTVYGCTAGVDCSGFVSQAWHTSSKYGTSTLPQISTAISAEAILPGDIFNDAGTHVALYAYTLGNGTPVLYEAAVFNTDINATGGWSYLAGYQPRRFDQITGTTVANPAGTLANPIAVTGLPYQDSRTTVGAPSDLLDGCGADPGKNESGRENIYRITIDQPGQLTATIFDDVNTDVDVHLYQSTNTSDCVARDDSTLTRSVDCGTYYVVVDTFRSASTGEHPGPYDLTITLLPSGGGCGAGPPSYDFAGDLGDPCAYSCDPDLPYCNRTLGAEVCVYTSGVDGYSFCSSSCADDDDCTGLGADACCEDFGDGEYYCMVADLCPAVDPPADAGADPIPTDGGGGADPADAGAAGPDGQGSGKGDGVGGGCRVAGRDGDLAPILLVLLGLAWRRRQPSAV